MPVFHILAVAPGAATRARAAARACAIALMLGAALPVCHGQDAAFPIRDGIIDPIRQNGDADPIAADAQDATTATAALEAAMEEMVAQPPAIAQSPVIPAAVPAASGEALAYEPGGMWMPAQIPAIHGATLRQMGLEIDPDVFADPLQFPLNAIVSLGGCSAAFVSPQGLILTNHHCVRGSLQYNATAAANYLEEGYLAWARDEELSGGPTARVYVTVDVQDVTSAMTEGLADIADDLARHQERERREKQIVSAAEAATTGTRCNVAAFYGGGMYFLITRLEVQDVRLVYAPHQGIGYFGGDEDNWMWPRQAGDFALLRAYVGPDGAPRPFAEDNVPFQPTAWLRVAEKGLEAGDLAMVVGYPGSTQRLATALETRHRLEWDFPRRIAQMRRHMQALRDAAGDDEDLKIKAAGQIFGMENSTKLLTGMMDGAQSRNLIASLEASENAMNAWIQADPARQARYGSAIADINALVEQRAADRDRDQVLQAIAYRGSSLLSAAITIVRMAEERPKPDAERDPSFQERNWERLRQSQTRMQQTYSRRLDLAGLRVYFEEAASRTSPEGAAPAFAFPENFVAQLEALFQATALESLEQRMRLLDSASLDDLQKSDDALIHLALLLRPQLKEIEDRDKAHAGAMLLARPPFFQAMGEWRQGRLAPDANGTIRVTYGTVRGYRPTPESDEYFPFTHVWQMAEKWAARRGQPPFNAPAPIIDAVAQGRFGPYLHSEMNEVPVNFLTDLDITGGNSGSATLNARGELVGVVFDGNIEGVASNLVFLDDVTRAIHVDVRYLNWTLDAVEGAHHLLREMGVQPHFSRQE